MRPVPPRIQVYSIQRGHHIVLRIRREGGSVLLHLNHRVLPKVGRILASLIHYWSVSNNNDENKLLCTFSKEESASRPNRHHEDAAPRFVIGFVPFTQSRTTHGENESTPQIYGRRLPESYISRSQNALDSLLILLSEKTVFSKDATSRTTFVRETFVKKVAAPRTRRTKRI